MGKMIRKLLVFENMKLGKGSLTYALWSDGVIERVVTKKHRVVFYDEVIPASSRED